MGRPVRALVRNPEAAKGLETAGAQLVVGDLADLGALARLLETAGAVVHCAGAVRGASQADFAHTNIEGTANLLTALGMQQPLPRLIMLSSLAARQPQLSWYASSKHQAEMLLREQHPGLDWIVLRPPPVYGPGDRELTPVFRWLARGIMPVPSTPDNRMSLLHVHDLACAITALLDAESLPRQALGLSDGKAQGYDWRELAELGSQVWGRRVRLLRLPGPLLDALAAANLMLARRLRYAPMLTPAKVRELRHPDWVTDNREIQAVIDWQPTISLAQGLMDL